MRGMVKDMKSRSCSAQNGFCTVCFGENEKRGLMNWKSCSIFFENRPIWAVSQKYDARNPVHGPPFAQIRKNMMHEIQFT
jgi:hypothetical protein